VYWLVVEGEDITACELMVAVTAAEVSRKESLFLHCISDQQTSSLAHSHVSFSKKKPPKHKQKNQTIKTKPLKIPGITF